MRILFKSRAAKAETPLPAEVLDEVASIIESQNKLDQELWQPEVDAQRYEQVFVDLWDRIRISQSKLKILAKVPFRRLYLPVAKSEERLERGIRRANWSDGSEHEFDSATWEAAVEAIRADNIEIIDTEWHHSRFVPASDTPPESSVSFTIHAKTSDRRFRVTGKLDIQWMPAANDSPRRSLASSSIVSEKPEIDTIHIRDLEVLERSSEGLFKNVLTMDISGGTGRIAILCHDLDGDNLVDIVIPNSNTILHNRGEGKFEREQLFENPRKLQPAAQIADFDGDQHADLFVVSEDGSPLLFRGDGRGQFGKAPHVCADIKLLYPLGMTCGDIDGDGDLDVWMTQRCRTSKANVMPQPYYDANNGWPSYLLMNDGLGNFEEITEEAGLAEKRNRWTFLATLIDLDEDGDLDLVNMSDFAGLDIYENDGAGYFRDVTSELIDNRYFFGMGLAFADFNQDSRLDFFGTGMASTTARRLEQLGLVREDRKKRSHMRTLMGYGNRLYFRDAERFREDPVTAPSVARTGWAWGATALDFDLDGDQDLYVSNGFKSGASCRDYCTRYWTQDMYVEDSGMVLKGLMNEVKADLRASNISWNGFEHNALLMNREDGSFLNVAALFDSAFVFDSRVAISEDFDCDGRPDLLVSQMITQNDVRYVTLHVYLNQLDTGHNWIGFQVADGGPGLSPIGATVSIETERGPQKQWLVTGDALLGQESFIAHFGLGTDRSVKAVTVRWPNGHTRRVEAPAIGCYHLIRPDSFASRPDETGLTANPALDSSLSAEGRGPVAR